MTYYINPLLGCYLIVEEVVTNDIAKQRCANDGGSLLLLKSKEEEDELKKLIGKIYSFNNLISGEG